MLDENLAGTYITTHNGVELYEVVVARNQCSEYIISFYDKTTQLNILMGGDNSEIVKMRTFIQKCRDWSNGNNPQLIDLQSIKP